jgi:hypothetical protein
MVETPLRFFKVNEEFFRFPLFKVSAFPFKHSLNYLALLLLDHARVERQPKYRGSSELPVTGGR